MENRVIVSIPKDERSNRWIFLQPSKDDEFGNLKMELTPREFMMTLQATGFKVDNNDYSEHGLRGVTRHVMDGSVVMGQVWLSDKEFDEYLQLNKDVY